MSVRLRSLVMGLTLALTLAGCGLPVGDGSHPAASGPSTSSTAQGASLAAAVTRPGMTTTAQAEQALAGVGIATVSRLGSSTPLVALSGPRVSVLLESQVAILAAQASAGGGTLGSDLDAAFPLGTSASSLPLTMTEVVGGWIVSAPDPAAVEAGRLMGTVDWTKPASVVLPTEVLDLFVGDVTQSVATARGAPSSSGPSAGDGSGAGSGAGVPSVDTPCTSLSAFVSQQVKWVFDQLHIDPDQVAAYISGHIGGFVGTFLGWLGRLGASIVNGLVDILHASVDEVIATFTAAVVSRLQVVIGSVFTVLQIVNLIRSHTVQVTATPTSNEVAAGTEPDHLGSFTASVPDNDETAGLPKQVLDCATFAHVRPPTVTRAGAAVHWQVTDPGHLVEVTSPSGPAGHPPTYADVMSHDVTSTLAYRTARVPSRAGQEYVGPVDAAVTVERTEVRDLRDMLDAALGEHLGLLAPFARAIVNPLLDLIEGKLPLATIAGHQVIGVHFWGGQPPTSSTPDCPAGTSIPAGTYTSHVHALLGTHEVVTLQGHRLLAAQAENLMTGTITLKSNGTRVTGRMDITGTSEGTGAADIGVPLHIHSAGSMRGSISGSAGSPTARLVLSGSYTDNDPLGGQHSGSATVARTVGLHVVSANCVSVTGDLAAVFRELIDQTLAGANTSVGHVEVKVTGNGTWLAEKAG